MISPELENDAIKHRAVAFIGVTGRFPVLLLL